MMKLLSLVLVTVWLVGQGSAFSSSDDPSFFSKTDNKNNNEDNNIITATANINKKIKLAGSDEAWQPRQLLNSKFTLQEDEQQRQLQSLDDQACDVLKDKLSSDNVGAICFCSTGGVTNTFTCVQPAKCVDETLTTCGGSGKICEVLTKTYGWDIQGSTVSVQLQQVEVLYTGGHLLSEEIEVISKDQCEYYMTTLDGNRYQCNDCSILDCPDGKTNVDCSNIQADSTTRGQCVSLTTSTADLGLLNKYCDDPPVVVEPTTLSAVRTASSAAAAGSSLWSTGSNYYLWYQNNVVLLATTTTAMLTFSMLMI